MRGDGRIYQRKGSSVYWCAYYQRGKEIRESTGKTTEKNALEYLKKRVREVANDRDGIKTFTGPRAERIKIACGVLDSVARKQSDCECLLCALERHLLLGGDKKKNLPVDGKLSRPENGILKRLHRDFTGRLATSLTPGNVDVTHVTHLAQFRKLGGARTRALIFSQLRVTCVTVRLLSAFCPCSWCKSVQRSA